MNTILNCLIFISNVLLNLVVEIGVPDTLAITLSELKKFEYVPAFLKKNKLIVKRKARTIAIFDFVKVLNIF